LERKQAKGKSGLNAVQPAGGAKKLTPSFFT